MLHASCWRTLPLAVLLSCTTPQTAGEKGAAEGAQPPDGGADAGVIVVRKVDPAVLQTWDQIKKLIDEQKFQQALDATLDRLEYAKGRRDEEDWTRALIRATQLRTGLHGYETSVRFLREQPWPQNPLHRATLELFYGQSIVDYVHAYQWEIRQREKVEAKGEVDLKAWTLDQLATEIQRAYQNVWALRESLGEKPVEAISEYVQPNDYPRNIRGTLRDAVSYLRVAHLADTTFWRPEHQNEVYRLDWPALIAARPQWASGVELQDPQVHPLAKIAAVLGDLEAWHRAQGHQEAALEARYERLQRLHDGDTDAARQKLVRADLEATLGGHKKVEWWAVGMAQLASFQRTARMQVRAHQTATACVKEYPSGIGGLRCLSVQQQLEAPDYTLQAMFHDGPDRRSIEVTHRNLEALHFRAWPLDLEGRLRTARDYNLLPSGSELLAFLSRKPEAAWKIELPRTPDYESHRTFVTPPMKRKGPYVVLASPRADFAQEANRILGVHFVVTELAITVRKLDDGSNEVAAYDAPTGEPQAAVEVGLYRYDYNRGHHLVETRKTNRDGLARFQSSSGRRDWGFFFLARRQADLALEQQGTDFYPNEEHHPLVASLVYTDRSIYRPLQKLHWKVVAFQGNSEQRRYTVLGSSQVTVRLVDPNGETVATKTVRTNSHGSASGEFDVPTGRLLGEWTVQSTPSGSATVRVEEYKRPTFTTEFKDAEGGLRLNKPATFKGEARYYFGLPVVTGSVRWRATREPVFPWWWGYWGFHPPGGGAAVQVIATGTSTLEPDGSFKLTFTPEAEEPRRKEDRALSYNYRVVADVTDEGGETRTAERTFRLGWVSIEAEVSSEEKFFLAGSPPELTVVRTNLDGKPRPGKGSWRLLAVQQPAQPQLPSEVPADPPQRERPEGQPEVVTPGDKLRPRWQQEYEEQVARWKDGAELARGELSHGESGEAKLTLQPLQPGPYRLRYQSTDDFGEAYETFHDFTVAAAQTKLEVPATLKAQRASARVGETARLFVHSGFAGQPMVFELWRDGERVVRRRMQGGEGALVELPIRETDRGGFTATLTVMRDHQLITLQESIFVPWDDKELKVELSTFRDKLRPGAKETFRVTVSGPKGQRVEAGAAELLAYMFDESLDYFAPHAPPGVMSLYPSRMGAPYVRSSLGPSQPQWVLDSGFGDAPPWPTLQPDVLRFYSGYAIGGPGMRGGLRMHRREAAMAQPMAGAAPAPEDSRNGHAEKKAVALEESAAPSGARADALASAPPPPGQAPAAEQPPELRSNFAETAFWQPHLLTQADGSVAIEFEVPDSVTGWNLWVHAVTRDLRGGQVTKKTRSVKDLMVRPYLPRFLREGDTAELNVVVNNASEGPLSGTVSFDLVDPQTQKSVLRDFGLDPARAKAPFQAEAGKGATVRFPIVTPKRPGTVAFKVTATSGNLSDGELRPIPVLPSRMHLAQSRFVTLHDAAQKRLTFEDMAKGDDPSLVHDQLVVTIDAQLFYTALQALPYLINYPYECTEQTLNRFVSSGILRSLYDQYPAVAQMAKKLSARETPLETWDAQDPNRKMALEETPWLVGSRGGPTGGLDLVNVLDPRIAGAEREAALARLQKAQTAIGGFPWFPGGPPSPYMTLYILHGLARAAEYGVPVPKELTVRAWGYVARHFREEYADRMIREDCCWEFLTFLNYVAASFPDQSWTGDALTMDERKAILAHSFKHWKEHSPYLKGYLALTLRRMDRPKDAKLVWDSVMDSAKTTEDQGTFWAPEDRGWLWYNDTIETHAFALRTLMELAPKDARRHGLVQWLLINKKLSHWKSTRATAEVIYALVKYLEAEKALGVREAIHVEVGPRKVDFVFEPDSYSGKNNRVVIDGPEVDPSTMSTITVSKQTPGFAFASATWHFSTDKLPEESRGDFFNVSRSYFKRERSGKDTVLRPLAEGQRLEVGDEVEVQLSLRNQHAAEYVHLRDPRAAGFEPENPSSRYKWDLGISWYEETRDSGTNFFFEWLPVGEYTFRYRLRVNLAGTFRVGPATVQSMYAPEFSAYSAGHQVVVGK